MQSPTTEQPNHYDIFISYRTTRRPWVETLAHNLAAQGYKVFLDAWELTAGDNFTRKIFSAMKHSRYALLIATPEAAESGWVQEEYEYMFNRSKGDKGFHWIPIVLGEFPDFPFLSNIQAVDFEDSAEEKYRIAFQKLLCGLDKQAPGANPYFSGDLIIPALKLPNNFIETGFIKQQHTFINSVRGYLEASTPTMILAQADTHTQHYSFALKQILNSDYPNAQIIHLFPPASTRVDSAAYFRRLARQCNFDEAINESWEWADSFRSRLDEGNEFVLLITGFENGPQESRGELAGELRGLISAYPFSLKLIVMGGERLAAAKYELGKHSFFNDLEEIRLLDISLEDFQDIYLKRYGKLILNERLIQEILKYTGKHPRLLESVLQQLTLSDAPWKEKISENILTSQLFSKFINNINKDELCKLLNERSLGRYEAWPQNTLIRNLYWQNLITVAEGKFIWRSELIIQSGKKLLQCN